MKRLFSVLILMLALAGCTRPYQPMLPPNGEQASLRRPTAVHRKPTIVLDAGHGGGDMGTYSQKQGYEEKKLCLATALWVRTALEKMGYRVVMTRTRDTFIPLTRRAQMANEEHAVAFVSLHYNASSNTSAHGMEVFYHLPNNPSAKEKQRMQLSKQLADDVIKGATQATHASSRGVKEANWAVLRHTNMPAILLEGGFLTNDSERQKLLNPQYLQHLATGVAKGIDRFVQQQQHTAAARK